MQPSPALLKELRTALASSKRKRKTVVSAGSRGTTLSAAPKASDHPSILNAGKRKANELVNWGRSTEPANRRPAPGAGCAPLPAFISVTGEQAVLGSRQLGQPEGRMMYAAALAGLVAQVSQVDRSSPQQWIRRCQNPLSHPIQPIGACLVVCPGI